MPKLTDKLRRPIPTPPKPDKDIAPQPQPDTSERDKDVRVKAQKRTDTKVHEADVKSQRRKAEPTETVLMSTVPLEKGESEGVPLKGAMGVWYRGQRWEPVACGKHRSPEVFEHSTDDKPAAPAGFQPGCEECEEELSTTIDHASRTAPLPVTV